MRTFELTIEQINKLIDKTRNEQLPISPALSKDIIRDIARINRIPYYGTKTKKQLLQKLAENNITHYNPRLLGFELIDIPKQPTKNNQHFMHPG